MTNKPQNPITNAGFAPTRLHQPPRYKKARQRPMRKGGIHLTQHPHQSSLSRVWLRVAAVQRKATTVCRCSCDTWLIHCKRRGTSCVFARYWSRLKSRLRLSLRSHDRLIAVDIRFGYLLLATGTMYRKAKKGWPFCSCY